MKELSKQFWKETSKLIDAHRKNNDERAAQGVVDSRIVFNKLVKKLTIPVVVKQSELLLCGVCDEETKHDVTLREELHCLKCGNVAKE
jgi:hypothetical protein